MPPRKFWMVILISRLSSILQSPLGMHAIDHSHKRRMNRVSDHTQQMFRDTLQGFLAQLKKEVLLRPEPWLAILTGHRETRRIGLVSATSVPRCTQEKHHRTGGHNGWNGFTSVGDYFLPEQVTFWNENGCPVVLGKFINSPNGGGAKGFSWPRNGIETVIEVQRLGGFSRQDIDDLCLAEQVVGLKQATQQACDSWMNRQ